MRSLLIGLLAISAVIPSIVRAETTGQRLITRPQATQHGLERAWFTYVETGGPGQEIRTGKLDRDRLFLQTSGGLLHALDSETGRQVWNVQLTSLRREVFTPTSNDNYVAALSGSTLTVIRRSDGVIHWQRKLIGAPIASPALGESYIFIAVSGGIIEIYPLDNPDAVIESHQTPDTHLNDPLAAPAGVYFMGKNGALQAFYPSFPQVRFDWKVASKVESTPTVLKTNVLLGGSDGFAYAVDSTSGATVWRYSAGEPVRQAPAGVDDQVYVITGDSGVHAISATTGNRRWAAPQVTRFIAASESRGYFTDSRNRLHVLDLDTGARLDLISIHADLWPVRNLATDRIYLVSRDGLVQSLHEIGQKTPLQHEAPALPPSADEELDAAEPDSTSSSSNNATVPATTRPAPPTPAPADDFDTFDENPFD